MKPASISIDALVEGENEIALDLSGAEIGIDAAELELDGAIAARLVIFRKNRTLEVRGTLAGAAIEACARCARPTRRAFEEFMRLFAMPASEGGPEVVEDEDLVYHDDRTLDVAEPIRQVLLVAAPMASLCREDCRGLCPRCGADRNETSCDCRFEEPDVRWRALDELLKKTKET